MRNAPRNRREDQVRAAMRAVRAGELIVIPTDTVYGIAADPLSAQSVARLLGAKGRDETKPPPVLGAEADGLLGLADFPSARQRESIEAVVEHFWPGPLTIVVRSRFHMGWDASSVGGTVALRMPALATALEVLRATGPLAVTSANRTGLPPAVTVGEAQEYFGGEVAVYIDGGKAEEPVPSSVVDFTGHEPRILRAGAVSIEQIRELIPSS